jgi:phenylalanyl-tRNA synthetase beta chain
LPVEVPHLCAAIYERQGDGVAGLLELKRAAACVMPGITVEPAESTAYEHPARTVSVMWQGETVGRIFEFHPSMVETGRAAVLDLDLSIVRRLSAGAVKYTPIRRYPSSAFDLSVLAGERELAGHLEAKVAGFVGPLLESCRFVRQYSGAPLPEGRKSVSFRVTVGSAERTLSSDEVSEIRSRIIEGMQQAGYDLRV